MSIDPTLSADPFAQCVKLVLVSEGGNDDDPRDPGGRTSRGITQREYDLWKQAHPSLPSDVWQAPQQTVLDIYQANYWIRERCPDLPRGVDYCVFDYGVNSGVSRGIKQLQSSLGVTVDGVIGPITLAAAKAVDPVAFINKYQDTRLAFLHSIGNWDIYGGGWGTRVASVRRDALTMSAIVPLTNTMLILRGITGTFGGVNYPHGALDEAPALEYATRHGYTGRVLDVSGETGPASPQTLLALREFHRDQGIHAFYGFSGGGYNLRHILNACTPAEKARIKLVVVLGAPDDPETLFQGPWELIYRTDPPAGHMDGPKALLAETPAVPPPKPVPHPDAPELHDLGHRVKRTMLALQYPWFDDQNVVSVEKMNPDGSLCSTGPNTFDDIKMVLDGDGKIIGGPWEATTHPGKFWTQHPMSDAGAFIIALGPNSCWTPGDYHGNEVWRQADGSTIIGHRDLEKTYKRQGDPKKYGNIGVHHHHGYNLDKNNISNAAAGCQVIRLNDKQEEYMRITKRCPRYLADPHGYRLTATVLRAEDLLP